jgi:group I intron endonuclease
MRGLIMSKYFFVYKTTHIPTGKYYIGKHVTSDLSDGYMGSGIALSKAIRKHGKESFKMEILTFCVSKEELSVLETRLVTQELVDDPMCYNLKLGGEGGWDHCPPKGRKLSDETRRKMSESHTGKSRPKRGPMSDEEKLRRSNALKGRKKPDGMGDKLRDHWSRLREESPEAYEVACQERSNRSKQFFESDENRQKHSSNLKASLKKLCDEVPGYKDAQIERAHAAAKISAAKTRKNSS